MPNKLDPKQIAFNHSKIYKKSSAKPYSFLLIDATLASVNPLRFRNNVLERI